MVQSGERFATQAPKYKRRRRVAESSEDSGSGLVPTLLDDVEQDLAVPCTEIDIRGGFSAGSERATRCHSCVGA